jgi:hypothetical protein
VTEACGGGPSAEERVCCFSRPGMRIEHDRLPISRVK